MPCRSHYTVKGRTLQPVILRRQKQLSEKLAYVIYLRHLDASAPGSPDVYLSQAARIGDCARFWSGFRCSGCGALHRMTTYGCKHRLCPTCTLRKSRAVAAQALQVMALISPEKHEFALLTLTQRNVPGERLQAELDAILAAWSQLRYVRDLRRDLIGWARSVEITVSDDDMTYHPHVHVILVVRKGASRLLTERYWRDLWALVRGLSYDPICHCTEIKSPRAVYEVSKYVTKIGQLLEDQRPGYLYDHVSTISDAIYGRRLRSYGGLWAKIRRQLSMVDVESMDDGSIDALGAQCDGAHGDTCSCGSQYLPYAMIWAGHDYKEVPLDVR